MLIRTGLGKGRDIRDKFCARTRSIEERKGERELTLRHLDGWLPSVGLEQTNADVSLVVDVRVVDLGHELDL